MGSDRKKMTESHWFKLTNYSLKDDHVLPNRPHALDRRAIG